MNFAKKTFLPLLVSLSAIFLPCTQAFAEQPDFASMETEEILKIQQQAQAELFKRNPKFYNIGSRGPGQGYVFMINGSLCYECTLLPGSDSFYNAEKLCKAYRGGGFADWRLPSDDELEAIYKNLADKKIVPWSSNYWSSNSGSSFINDRRNFSFGKWSSGKKDVSSTDSYEVIAVRTFTMNMPPDAGITKADGSVSFDIDAENIKFSGNASEYIRAAEGTYTLKIRSDNQIVMNIKVEVTKTFDPAAFPKKSYEGDNVKLNNYALSSIFICDEDGFKVVDQKNSHLKCDMDEEAMYSFMQQEAGSVCNLKLTLGYLTESDINYAKKQKITYIEFQDFKIERSH